MREYDGEQDLESQRGFARTSAGGIEVVYDYSPSQSRRILPAQVAERSTAHLRPSAVLRSALEPGFERDARLLSGGTFVSKTEQMRT